MTYDETPRKTGENVYGEPIVEFTSSDTVEEISVESGEWSGWTKRVTIRTFDGDTIRLFGH